MTAQYFVDTNVLVYFRDTSDSAKHVRAYEWLDELTRTANATTSFQVLNEFYDVVTRRRRIGMTPEAARADVRDYLAIWEPMLVTEQVIEWAWATQDTFGFSWWDSLIVASARLSGCAFLLTEDLQHGQQIDELTVVSPFQAAPDDIAR